MIEENEGWVRCPTVPAFVVVQVTSHKGTLVWVTCIPTVYYNNHREHLVASRPRSERILTFAMALNVGIPRMWALQDACNTGQSPRLGFITKNIKRRRLGRDRGPLKTHYDLAKKLPDTPRTAWPGHRWPLATPSKLRLLFGTPVLSSSSATL